MNDLQQKRTKPTSGLAITSLVLGGCTLLSSIIPFLNFIDLVMGPVGIVLGSLAIRQVKRHGEEMKGGGVALTGLLLNVAGVAMTLLVLMLFMAGSEIE
ncbi:DUF4190 domain-containing protein [Tumebacillus permanentifrigoris]|uniref:Uncharacterized protein DUF4190 n=1 Tax=Tumebacillus permanentifrigoris TaxID=378543 RepID=A0A316DAN1_9BACL|nr:DUF4190 domain-containing protein [Tumebacillus permanentifrigoris]PWK13740.1 uncharacterized protein DUF4190 [Tumebacillus permanentifrigoris]